MVVKKKKKSGAMRWQPVNQRKLTRKQAEKRTSDDGILLETPVVAPKPLTLRAEKTGRGSDLELHSA
jgi:hypothetical protein